MSIENGVTTGAPKTAAQGVTGHGHGKARAGTAAPGDFAALLMNLGAEELPLEPALATAGEAVLADAAGTSELPTALPAVLPDAPLPGLALPPLGQPQVPASLEAGLAPALTGDVAAVTADARAPATGLPLVAEAAGTPGRATRGRADPLPAQADEARDAALAQPVLTDAAADETTPATGEVQPLLRQAALAQRLAQRTQATEVAAQEAREQRGEAIAARLGWQVSERQTAAAGNQPQFMLAAGSGEAGLRPFERRAEKIGERSAGVGDAGAWNAAAMPDGARPDVPAVAPDAGLMTQTRVAEQVSYWVNRGVQNAELELDGLGEGAVSVSIALQGQEARVEFRADQVQTRQVLEDSMPHLRELLAREGLVLSGASVGSSGAEGGKGQPSQGRQGGRQAQVGVPDLPAAVAGAAARGSQLTGRSVDLFV